MDMNLGKLWEMERETGKPGVLQSTGSGRVRHNLETEQQQEGTGSHMTQVRADMLQLKILHVARKMEHPESCNQDLAQPST